MAKQVDWCVFLPAFGRVYETAEDVLKAFHENKDFRCVINGFEAYSTKREVLSLSDCRGFEIRFGRRHEKVTAYVEVERV